MTGEAGRVAAAAAAESVAADAGALSPGGGTGVESLPEGPLKGTAGQNTLMQFPQTNGESQAPVILLHERPNVVPSHPWIPR